MIFPLLPPREGVDPIVGIATTSNGQICDVHCFGCGNELLLARLACGCGILLQLRKVEPDMLAAFFVLCDGSDECWVGFTT